MYQIYKKVVNHHEYCNDLCLVHDDQDVVSRAWFSPMSSKLKKFVELSYEDVVFVISPSIDRVNKVVNIYRIKVRQMNNYLLFIGEILKKLSITYLKVTITITKKNLQLFSVLQKARNTGIRNSSKLRCLQTNFSYFPIIFIYLKANFS